jgi:hypothetical protein
VNIDRRSRQDRYRPRRPGDELAKRKQLFDGLNKFIMDRGGWIVSVPGDRQAVFEVLPHSPIPAQLTELGYDVRPADFPEGQRLLATGITEFLTRTSSGALEPLVEGSTKPVEVRHHAGIVPVKRFVFSLP